MDGFWKALDGFFTPIGRAIAALMVGAGKGVAWAVKGVAAILMWIANAIGRMLGQVFSALWRAACWCFDGVRPLRFLALLFILTVGGALAYVNTLGAWRRTEDIGYTVLVGGIEGIVLVALPLVFVVKGWFNTTVAALIFCTGVGIASINAKPAIETILAKGEVSDPAELHKKADRLDEEVFGFKDPETNERISSSGLIFKAERLEGDASRNRTELGHTTASIAVDQEAQIVRREISDKLALAAKYRATAAGAIFNTYVAIATFVIAELIRSFGLKVFVGFAGELGEKKRGIQKEFTKEEWAKIERALKHRDNFEKGMEKAKETRELSGLVTDVDWARQIKKTIWDMHLAGATVFEIAEAVGWHPSELRVHIERLFKREEVNAIKAGREPDNAAAE